MSTKQGKAITMAIVGIICALVPMKKGKVLALAVIASMCTIAWLFSPYPTTALFFVAAAVLFGGIWYCKHLRDNYEIEKAHRPLPQPTQQHITQRTASKQDNTGLFLPASLDERK